MILVEKAGSEQQLVSKTISILLDVIFPKPIFESEDASEKILERDGKVTDDLGAGMIRCDQVSYPLKTGDEEANEKPVTTE